MKTATALLACGLAVVAVAWLLRRQPAAAAAPAPVHTGTDVDPRTDTDEAMRMQDA